MTARFLFYFFLQLSCLSLSNASKQFSSWDDPSFLSSSLTLLTLCFFEVSRIEFGWSYLARWVMERMSSSSSLVSSPLLDDCCSSAFVYSTQSSKLSPPTVLDFYARCWIEERTHALPAPSWGAIVVLTGELSPSPFLDSYYFFFEIEISLPEVLP